MADYIDVMASTAFADSSKVDDRHPSALVTAVVLSLALHVGIALLLTYKSSSVPKPPPNEMVMEVVQMPKPPDAPAPAPPAPQALPPPPPPQLTEAPIAEKSVAPTPTPPSKSAAGAHERVTTAQPEEKRLAVAPSLPANSGEPTAPVSRERPSRPAAGEEGGKIETASQTVQDFVLMQVAREWILDLHSPRFSTIEIKWEFVLRPDGTLGAPFGRTDPWDLARMVDSTAYANMQQPTEEARILRTVATTFLQAVRQAQPFRMPPNEASYKNRVLPLRFRIGDLPQGPTAGR